MSQHLRVLFDTNVVLDVLLARAPHAAPSASLFDYVARKELEGCLCASTITMIDYLATKAVGAAQARKHVQTLLDIFDIAAVSRVVLSDALYLGFKDFDDAVLHEAARHSGATAIVTRDPKGFANAKLKIFDPAELLRLIRASA